MFAFVAFTIVCEHGDRFLSSSMSLWYMRRPCVYIVFVLYSKLCHCGMAGHSNSVAFSWFPSLPPLSWFRVSPSVLGFSLCFEGLFILLPLGFWPQCDGCYSGGLGVGGLVAGLQIGRPVGVLPPWGVIAVAAPCVAGPWAPNLHLRHGH